MSEKKYVGSEALIRLVAQLKAGFASLTHTHKLEDITDYTVDSALSSTSTNPVQNQALKSKFDSVDAAVETAKTELAADIAAVEEQIVQSDWNENDPESAAYIQNRTHWLGDPVETMLIENATVTNGSELSFTIEQNTTYVIIWNGERYERDSFRHSIFGHWTIGNESFLYSANDTKEPFMFLEAENADGVSVLFTNDTEVSHTVSISSIVHEINKIDEKYLPNGATIGANGTGLYGEIFNNYSRNIASGNYSHAEGTGTTASGDYSHAEGAGGNSGTIASGEASHAEGYSTTASGDNSHAEGYDTTASNYNAHAEGNTTIASGHSSHAEGRGTIAAGDNQHVQGMYNIEDTLGAYAHIVGNGRRNSGDDPERSNAHTLDWGGNAWYSGKIYVGGSPTVSGNTSSHAFDYSSASEVALKSDFESLEASIDEKIGNIDMSTYETTANAQAKLDEAKAYADSAATTVKNDLLNGAGGAYDTLKELGDLIDVNVDAIEALETVAAGKADADHTHDDRYYTESEIDSKVATINSAIEGKAAASHSHDDLYYTESEIDAKVSAINTVISGKADSSHTHTIANITNLQSTLDGKAASSHTHAISDITGLEDRLAAIEAMLISITDSEIDSICGA